MEALMPFLVKISPPPPKKKIKHITLLLLLSILMICPKANASSNQQTVTMILECNDQQDLCDKICKKVGVSSGLKNKTLGAGCRNSFTFKIKNKQKGAYQFWYANPLRFNSVKVSDSCAYYAARINNPAQKLYPQSTELANLTMTWTVTLENCGSNSHCDAILANCSYDPAFR